VIDTLLNFVDALYYVYLVLIFVYIVMSWVRLPYNIWIGRLRGFLEDTVVPFLRLFRNMVPPIGGMDLSPILAFIVLWLVHEVLIRILISFQ
jgi:YggT family protein